ncbi:ankyrin repeat domain-containing protein [Oecophyllibacter saccharovorans]|uniref:Ankyrin repeat domain-containing protein n=1 Tax=Oecophyllibacter saccharovorans TaxID=2558360 RepID=A0A506ULZ7_9PROT|nr:ankyrin repeat domain-containing protein [Oecophyllibacter saccharovorans]QDH15540.1 ankyrin repeat domain-containing protein [Oecophyllibacter saccharovorans]TPW34374.1 ankyrin repeat domain-containing protein [Oecophyllibacter saccharovorans]
MTQSGTGQAAPSFTPEQITALFFEAARSGDTELLGQFLDAGMPVNSADSAGYTPLTVATYNNQLEAARLLLQRGADPEALDNKGASALAGVAFKGLEPVAELLIAHGAEVDRPNHAGRTPLMFAIMFGRENMARLLLQHGADPERTDMDGLSARALAQRQGLKLFEDPAPESPAVNNRATPA